MEAKYLTIKELTERIIEKPYYTSFHNGYFKDTIKCDGVINYEGLDINQKLCLFVFARNISGYMPNKKSILKFLDISNYKFQKIIKELKGAISIEPAFDEHTGLLSGRGYFYYDIKY